MNDLGNEIFNSLNYLHKGSEKEQEKFSNGLAFLQNKYADFFEKAKGDGKLITNYFTFSNPIHNSSVKSITFKDYDKLPPELELEVIDLFKSSFTV